MLGAVAVMQTGLPRSSLIRWPMERPRILWLLRIAFSAVCGIICLLLIVLWVRSYARHDGIWGRISQAKGFHASSHEGRLQLNTFRNLGIVDWRLASRRAN